MMTKKKISLISGSLLVSLLFGLSIFFFEDIYYHLHVTSSNDLKILQLYIEKYPNGKYTNEVNINIDTLMFENALLTNTIESFKNYISQAPTKAHVDEANTHIDTLMFENALQTNTIESFKNYISQAPTKAHVDEAKHNIELLEYKEALKSNEYKMLMAFLEKYPSSEYYNDIEDKIISIKWDIRSPKEAEEAKKYFRITESPLARKYTFRDKVYLLKIFANKHPRSRYVSLNHHDFLEKIVFTTRDIPLVYEMKHTRRRCANWLCTEYNYPGVRDYYASQVYENEIVIYDAQNSLIRTIHDIDGKLSNIDKLVDSKVIYDKSKRKVKFISTYKLCSDDCDATYKSSGGEPLDFHEAFGKINNKVLKGKIEDYLTHEPSLKLASKYKNTQLIQSKDKTKSYFVLNQAIDFVADNPLMAAAIGVGAYLLLKDSPAPSYSGGSSSYSSYSPSSSYNSECYSQCDRLYDSLIDQCKLMPSIEGILFEHVDSPRYQCKKKAKEARQDCYNRCN